ncbi:MAG TPA: DUF4145 domain-containing protein [Terracidiphilus sp.]|nr:DUF4145 domain-containing protein [Terracidiphilus sp.]
MGSAFSWSCPYCNRDATIIESNTATHDYRFNCLNKEGNLDFVIRVIVCPHPRCREYTISAYLFRVETTSDSLGNRINKRADAPFLEWILKPKSGAKPFPVYIPKPILDDYDEACLILNDSPKASATLSRRCLQGVIRDFWGVSKDRLIDEIAALKDKIDPTTWAAIDAVRGVGNIGAHMEKDINLIVDVDANEAQLLIGLIEFLLKDWYIGRHERAEHMKQVIALGVTKAAAKKVTPHSP